MYRSMPATFVSGLLHVSLVMSFSGSLAAAQQPVVAPHAEVDAAAPAELPPPTPDAVDPVPVRSPGESLARIVRLSQVRGAVQVDRNTGQGFERAAPNMPLVQGVRLRTGDGLAEVEFEDNSSLRLTPGTEVDFPALKLRQTGTKVSSIRVSRGSVYVSLAAGRDQDLSVAFADQTLTLAPSSHVHLSVGQPTSYLVVFSGEAHLQGPLGVTTATRKQTVTLDTSNPAAPLVAKGLVEGPYDQWDKDGAEYQKRYAVANTFAGSPYAYGLADLNYYGGFFNTAGCGQMWQPYFAGAGWSPYSAGLWTWYPGAGYSWVSMYPWGWTPFHSGEWALCDGRGWGWRPSGGWNGIQNLRRLHVTGTSGGSPIKPPPPPVPRQPTVLLVKSGSAVPVSGLQPTGEFRFQNNSAGLGIPRGSFDKLGKLSRGVDQHGSLARTPSDHAINTITAGRPGVPAASFNQSATSSAHSVAASSSHASASTASSGHSAPSAPSSASSGGAAHK